MFAWLALFSEPLRVEPYNNKNTKNCVSLALCILTYACSKVRRNSGFVLSDYGHDHQYVPAASTEYISPCSN